MSRSNAIVTSVILYLLWVAAVGSAATTRSTAVSCTRFMSSTQAASLMDVTVANLEFDKVAGHTKWCSWFGFTKSGPVRSVAVKWGPYVDFRKRADGNGKAVTCAVSAVACKLLTRAIGEKPNEASFELFQASLARVGSARTLPARAFGGYLAFAWVPDGRWEEESRLGPTTFAFVYDPHWHSMLAAICGDKDDVPPLSCAIQTAKIAFANFHS